MITLKGITWDHPRGFAPLAASEGIYEAGHAVRVRWDKRSLKDFGDAPVVDLAQDYDLIVLDHPHMGAVAHSRCLLPLDELLAADELGALENKSAGPSFRSYFYDDHQWALPVDAACQVAAYRPDLLGESSLPETWEDVFRLSESLRGKDLHVGMALCPTDVACSFLTLCAQLGDGPVEGRMELVAPDTGLQALGLLRRLREVCHPDCHRWNPIALYDHMASAEGRIAYSPLAFGYTNYARPGYAERQLSFGGIPGRTHALLGGAGIGISSGCQHQHVAVDYLRWICGADYQRTLYVEHGGQPGNGVAWSNDRADELAGSFFSQSRATIESAYMRPRSSGWPAFQEFLGNRVHKYLLNVENPETVLDELQHSMP